MPLSINITQMMEAFPHPLVETIGLVTNSFFHVCFLRYEENPGKSAVLTETEGMLIPNRCL